MKLFVLWTCLQLRQQYPELFREGAYCPLGVQGPGADSVCAFARILTDEPSAPNLVVAVPRFCQSFPESLLQMAGTTEESKEGRDNRNGANRAAEPFPNTAGSSTLLLDDLPAESYHHLITGKIFPVTDGGLPLEEVFAEFPLALLISNP